MKRDPREKDIVFQAVSWFVRKGRRQAADAIGTSEDQVVVTPDGIFVHDKAGNATPAKISRK